MKSILSVLILLFLFSETLEAKKCGSSWCCAWRYWSHQCELNENVFYGYVDNLNYPDPTYRLPVNCCFNYCPPCTNHQNQWYLQQCMRYTREKWASNGHD